MTSFVFVVCLISYFLLQDIDALQFHSLHSLNPKLPQELLVETSQGWIHGVYRPSYESKEIFYSSKDDTYFHRAFLGIPFAKPPVKKLRFADAEGFKSYHELDKENSAGYKRDSVLMADKYGAACMQYMEPFKKSEDCLFINVFTPHHSKLFKPVRRDDGKKKKLVPVVFFIFGGAMNFGDGYFKNYYDPRKAIAEHDVIYVTFNHRVNAFGFLFGSYAYSDVKLALEWTKENIAAFGGDPDDITVMGMSSGAQMATYLLTDLHAPTFKKAVILSAPLILQPKSDHASMKILKAYAKTLGCYGRGWKILEWFGMRKKRSAEKMLDCLRKVPALALQTATGLIWKGFFTKSHDNTPIADTIFWGPRAKDVANPIHLLNNPSDEFKQRISGIDFMFGVAQHELAMFLEPFALSGRTPTIPFLVMGSDRLKLHRFLGGKLKQYASKLIPKWKKSILKKSMALPPTSRDFKSMTHARALYVDNIISLFGRGKNGNADNDVNAVLTQYPPSDNKQQNFDRIVHLLSIYAFHCPLRKFMHDIRKYSGGTSTTRVYEFRHLIEYMMPKYGPNSLFLNATKVMHSTDIPLFFNSDHPKLHGKDKTTSRFMIDQLMAFVLETKARIKVNQVSDTEFDINGDNRNSGKPFKWPLHTDEEDNWVFIGPNEKVSVQQGLYRDECNFWDQLGYRF